MIYALATPIFLAWSALFGTQAQASVGSMTTFTARTLLAFSLLLAYALLLGDGYEGPGFVWLFIGGILGFGLGDMSLFAAYSRIGARLTLLIWQCLAVPFSGFFEWGLLATRPTLLQVATVGVILLGVVLVLNSRSEADQTPAASKGRYFAGVAAAVGAAAGQALGTVCSRYAYAVNDQAGISIDGMTAAFQRINGGACVALAVMVWLYFDTRRRGLPPLSKRRGWRYVTCNALCGPVLAIGAFQAALMELPSAIVVAISATSPIVIIPFAWWLNRDQPKPMAVVGSLLATVGVVALLLW